MMSDLDRASMAVPLGPEEKFALSRIFAGDDEYSVAVREGLADAELVSRADTNLGFQAKIRFARPLPSIVKAVKMDWYFKHRSMQYGGAFICTYDSPEVLFIDGISFYGDWPDFNADAFAPLTG
jgi:hypothetical protein